MLAGVISSILYLVAGFRTSVGWGIANLLPFGSLVFTICRWQAAKNPFLLSVVSGILAFATVTVASQKLNGGMPLSAEALEDLAKSIGNPEPGSSSGELTALREEEVALEEHLRATTVELKLAYEELLAKRKELPPNDTEAVRRFNEQAAAYEARKQQHAAERAELDSVRQAILKAVEERRNSLPARGTAGGTAGGPEVTVYSTSWCGPCKMAKAHLKKRGVAFNEIDVEKSPEGAEKFRKLGGGGVPLIVINGEKVRGFDPQQIDALLDKG